jgi:Kef-type K+ transport system membrane component KefB/Trk K+ transport system NAD-binding subunit
MTLFAEFSVLFLSAAAVAFCLQLVRLPAVVGYLMVGLVLGPFSLGILHSTEVFELLAQIGMCALLFSVGLHVNAKAIKDMGKTVLKIGVIQLALNVTLGLVIGRVVGFSWMASALLGAALSFNSTVLALRSLGERGDLGRNYGKITTGILLLQDVFATIVLLIVGIAPLQGGASGALGVLGRGVILVAAVFALAHTLLPKIMERAARSQELLAIGSLAFALGMSLAFHAVGWSYELGALLAGICLANTSYRFEIESKLKPIQELFLVVFFVLLGSKIDPTTFQSGWGIAVVLILCILCLNPWVIGRLMRHFGHARAPSFLVAVHLSHLSEFSLLLLFVASRTMTLPASFISAITVAVGCTMLGGSLYMAHADRLRLFLERLFGFKRDVSHAKPDEKAVQYDVILFGCHRVGSDFLPALKKMKAKYLVVDYDPEAIADLEAHGIACRYGDVEDLEFLREIGAHKAKMIISTIPNDRASTAILALRKRMRPLGTIILVAQTIDAALAMYRQGATYVILPHVLGGNYASQLVEVHGLKKEGFEHERLRHIAHLKTRGTYVSSVPMLSRGRWR